MGAGAEMGDVEGAPDRVVRHVPEGADVEARNWRRHAANPKAAACVRLAKPVDDGVHFSWRSTLLAGTCDEVLDAASRLSGGMRGATVEVLHLDGFGNQGGTVDLLQSAVLDVLSPSSRPDRTKGAARQALSRRVEALPRAKAALRVAERLMAGEEVSPRLVEGMDAALRDVTARRICAERGLRVGELARALGTRGWPDPDGARSAWDRAMFGPDPCPGGDGPVEVHDLARLHAAVRWVTGEDRSSGRPEVPHDSGGCAAFAVMLNRVLDGRGRYVLSGDPAIAPCSHVALRVGDRICDGSGVHEPDAFHRRWCDGDGILELLDTSGDGDLVRCHARSNHGLDEVGLERDLREALGLSPPRAGFCPGW